MDHRGNTRVPLDSTAEVQRGGDSITGDVQNLSLSGLYLKSPDVYDAGTPVEITLYLSGSAREIQIPLKGVIIRNDTQGMAVQFQQLELDGIINLNNIIIYSRMEIDKKLKDS
ncbi:MAG: PilZ domain-containing protein [Spirochaetes bacterium]|nr:PilZ domain-containing protein [Spirochaetota bacterium]